MRWKMFFLISLVFFFVLSLSGKALAADWPATNLNSANNANTVDMTAFGHGITAPSVLNIPQNLQDYIIGDNKLYYSDGLTPSTIYAVNLGDLSPVWSKKFDQQISRLVYTNQRIYFGTSSFNCIDAENGNTMWSTPSINNVKVFQVSDGKVYGVRFNSNMSNLVVLNITDGSILFDSPLLINDGVNDITVSSSKIYLTAGLFHGGGSFVYMWDKSNYSFLAKSISCRSSNSTTVLDEVNNMLYLTGADAAFCSYRADSLAAVVNNRWDNLYRLVKYGNAFYTTYATYMADFGAMDATGHLGYQYNLLDGTERFYGNPIIVNGVLYAGTNQGKVVGLNLETGEKKAWVINAGQYVKKIIYGGGKFIIRTSAASPNEKLFIYDFSNFNLSPVSTQVSLSSPYKTGFGYNQYLGQTHSHYLPEDQIVWLKTYIHLPTASDVETRYRDAGYDFICLTEHNSLTPSPGVEGILHIANSEEITQDVGGNHILAEGITTPIDLFLGAQERIDGVVGQGGVPILSHPNSKQYEWPLSDLLNLSRYTAIEIFNESFNHWRVISAFSGSADSTDKWDLSLTNSKNIFGTAGDDYTPEDGGFDGAAVVVFAKSDTQSEILSNLKAGNFYAVQGSSAPRLNIEVINNQITITADKSSTISFIGENGKLLKKETGANQSVYTIQGNEIYVRAEVDASGKKSWTQPVFIQNIETGATRNSGEHITQTNQAILESESTGNITAQVLARDQYPSTDPPAGYLSPVYDFSTDGQLLNGVLAINYSGQNIPVNQNNLSVFSYNDSAGTWDKVSSVVDSEKKVVTANLPHFSKYTLSSDIPVDAESPSINLVSPTDLSNLSGNVTLNANAVDNQAVTEVTFVLDGKTIGADIDLADGWKTNFDSSNFTNGNHKLTLSAEDFTGNRAEKEYDIGISGGISIPSVSIIAPTTSEYLHDSSAISGNFSSQLAIDQIGIFIDEVFIDNTEIDLTNSKFTKTIDWSKFKDGEHKLKIVLADTFGNTAQTEEDINIGQNVTANINLSAEVLSKYSQLYIDVTPNPSSANIKIYLDGSEVTNHSYINMIGYPTGTHTLEVKFEGNVIATASFTLGVNYQDTASIIRLFFQEGFIRTYGGMTSILSILQNAAKFDQKELFQKADLTLENLVQKVQTLADLPKPGIENYAAEIIIDCLKFLQTG